MIGGTSKWPPLRPATSHHEGESCCPLLLLLLRQLLVHRGQLDGVEIVAVEQCNGGGENHTQFSALLECFGFGGSIRHGDGEDQ